jgi:hypothetical protein
MTNPPGTIIRPARMPLEAITLTLTDLETGRALARALVCAEARYASILWPNASRPDRRHMSPVNWRHIEAVSRSDCRPVRSNRVPPSFKPSYRPSGGGPSRCNAWRGCRLRRNPSWASRSASTDCSRGCRASRSQNEHWGRQSVRARQKRIDRHRRSKTTTLRSSVTRARRQQRGSAELIPTKSPIERQPFGVHRGVCRVQVIP